MTLSGYEQLFFDDYGLELDLKAFTEGGLEMVHIGPWPLAVSREDLDLKDIRDWVANKIKTQGELREI